MSIIHESLTLFGFGEAETAVKKFVDYGTSCCTFLLAQIDYPDNFGVWSRAHQPEIDYWQRNHFALETPLVNLLPTSPPPTYPSLESVVFGELIYRYPNTEPPTPD
jgi:hypothetical protein